MTAPPRIRVALADDHALVLEGLCALLQDEPDLEVVATATSGDALVAAIRAHAPDVAVLDLEMPPPGGLACLERVRRERLPVRVLVLSAYSDGATMRAALQAGADGYALKTEPPRQTVDAIREVFRGHLVFPAAARRWLVGHPGTSGATDELTEREAAVLALVAEGVPNAGIAARLRMSANTVKFHLRNVFRKLDVDNRTEAAAVFLGRRRAGG